jgi:hypothetical protein
MYEYGIRLAPIPELLVTGEPPAAPPNTLPLLSKKMEISRIYL